MAMQAVFGFLYKVVVGLVPHATAVIMAVAGGALSRSACTLMAVDSQPALVSGGALHRATTTGRQVDTRKRVGR